MISNDQYIRFTKEKDVVKKFNIFLEIYCSENYAHLIDSDQNAGQEMRNAIQRLQSGADVRIMGKTVEEVCEILEGLDIEKKHQIPVTMKNLKRLVELYHKEQQELLKKANAQTLSRILELDIEP